MLETADESSRISFLTPRTDVPTPGGEFCSRSARLSREFSSGPMQILGGESLFRFNAICLQRARFETRFGRMDRPDFRGQGPSGKWQRGCAARSREFVYGGAQESMLKAILRNG